MPRTTTVECPGCPPFRALTFDALGLIKVIEARGQERGIPKVVDRWGDPDSSKCVLAASIHDRKTDPLLAVARKSGVIEVLNPLNGEVSVTVSDVGNASARPEDDAIVGLHLFRRQRLELTSRSCNLLTCTTKGNASIETIVMSDSSEDSGASKKWNVCGSGRVLKLICGILTNVLRYGLQNLLLLTASVFLPLLGLHLQQSIKDDHRKVVAGTNSHQVRLYDVSAQRRPVISFDFRETPIKAVTEDLDGHTIYIGNGSGDLASVDIRTGLDSYLRIWDIGTRQLLSSVFLKQHLTKVVFDTNFTEEEVKHYATDSEVLEPQSIGEVQTADETEKPPTKRKKSSKENRDTKKQASREKDGSKKLKSKKRSKSLEHDIADDA
ncbi:hypothetical protein PTKIN_Ptkin04bG0031600 [Pterospermum kingtungense]